jgi:hypothetical protein
MIDLITEFAKAYWKTLDAWCTKYFKANKEHQGG